MFIKTDDDRTLVNTSRLTRIVHEGNRIAGYAPEEHGAIVIKKGTPEALELHWRYLERLLIPTQTK